MVLLNADSPRVEECKNAMVHNFRQFFEEYSIKRHLQMINIFVKTAAKASYPLEMLINVANPYHIRLLLKLLIFVSNEVKIMILRIFKTLLRIGVPLKIYESATEKDLIDYKTESTVKFRSKFVQALFNIAL